MTRALAWFEELGATPRFEPHGGKRLRRPAGKA